MGRLHSPFGTEYVGFKVTIGGEPKEVERSYADIDAIFKSNPGAYKVSEEKDENGKFKSFIVET